MTKSWYALWTVTRTGGSCILLYNDDIARRKNNDPQI